MKKLFLVACPRSGTTWLQLILDSHPKIATRRETHLFDGYVAALYNLWQREISAPHKDGLRVLLSEPEFDNAIARFCEVVFGKIAASNPVAEYVLEKTPGHLRYHRTIRTLYPEARFLHLVRDPRAVVASLLAARKEPWGTWAPADVFEAARRWREDVFMARHEIGRYGDDYCEVRYEDLAAAPDAVLARICEWLGVEPIRYDANRFSLPEIKKHIGEGDPANPAWENRSNFFRYGAIDGWRTELTGPQIGVIEGTCAGLLEEFGYAPSRVGILHRKRQ